MYLGLATRPSYIELASGFIVILTLDLVNRRAPSRIPFTSAGPLPHGHRVRLQSWTYLLQGLLGVVLLLLVVRVVDQGERGGPAATELSLHTKDCNALFLRLEHLRELLPDLGLAEHGVVGVDDLERLSESNWGAYHLFAGEQGVPEELADVKDELRLCHSFKQ